MLSLWSLLHFRYQVVLFQKHESGAENHKKTEETNWQMTGSVRLELWIDLRYHTHQWHYDYRIAMCPCSEKTDKQITTETASNKTRVNEIFTFSCVERNVKDFMMYAAHNHCILLEIWLGNKKQLWPCILAWKLQLIAWVLTLWNLELLKWYE